MEEPALTASPTMTSCKISTRWSLPSQSDSSARKSFRPTPSVERAAAAAAAAAAAVATVASTPATASAPTPTAPTPAPAPVIHVYIP